MVGHILKRHHQSSPKKCALHLYFILLFLANNYQICCTLGENSTSEKEPTFYFVYLHRNYFNVSKLFCLYEDAHKIRHISFIL